MNRTALRFVLMSAPFIVLLGVAFALDNAYSVSSRSSAGWRR